MGSCRISLRPFFSWRLRSSQTFPLFEVPVGTFWSRKREGGGIGEELVWLYPPLPMLHLLLFTVFNAGIRGRIPFSSPVPLGQNGNTIFKKQNLISDIQDL